MTAQCGLKDLFSVAAGVHRYAGQYRFVSSIISCTLDSAPTYLAFCPSKEVSCLFVNGSHSSLSCRNDDGLEFWLVKRLLRHEGLLTACCFVWIEFYLWDVLKVVLRAGWCNKEGDLADGCPPPPADCDSTYLPPILAYVSDSYNLYLNAQGAWNASNCYHPPKLTFIEALRCTWLSPATNSQKRNWEARYGCWCLQAGFFVVNTIGK